jgi:hypothetical protein
LADSLRRPSLQKPDFLCEQTQDPGSTATHASTDLSWYKRFGDYA